MPIEKTQRKAEQSQVDKFREAARELETDDREEVFDAALKRVMRAPSSGGRNPKEGDTKD